MRRRRAPAAAVVELDGHQPGGELDDVGLEPEVAQGVGRLQAEQAAADHHAPATSGAVAAAAAMASRSSMVRYTKHPGPSDPSIGGTNGYEPVARTSRS